MTVQEQLLKAAEELNYDDDCGGKATSAFCNHLKMIAKNASQLEAAGFEVKTDLTPRHLGSSRVSICRNGITLEMYSVFYDRYSACYGSVFFDEQRAPLEKLLEAVLKVAQMFSPAA